MVSRFIFFNLPRELRDIIYEYYLIVDGGYVCDTDSFIKGTLRKANNEPIDLALAYACKRSAEEMDGLALRLNSITFSTLYSEDLRILAGRFERARSYNIRCRNMAVTDDFGHSFPDALLSELQSAFPEYPELMQLLHTPYIDTPHGAPPSIYNEFFLHALRLLVSHDKQRCIDISKQASKRLDGDDYFESHSEYLFEVDASRELDFFTAAAPNEYWTIPSEDDLERLALFQDDHRETIMRCDREKYRFSAAAASIFFLQSLPNAKRKHVRNMILLEDRESVGNPECHACGLIPFCQENPDLRIERRVDLWKSVFKAEWRMVRHFTGATVPSDASLASDSITHQVALWVMEAAGLSSAGMPPDSFRLILDGDPLPQQCEQIFQLVVQRDIAWQLAVDELVRQQHLPSTSWGNERDRILAFQNSELPIQSGQTFKGFPQAMNDIARNKSVVRFNFYTGVPLDVEKLVQERRMWTQLTWVENWRQYTPAMWPTMSPLPSWADLLRDNLLPKSEMPKTSRYRGGLRSSRYRR